MTYDLSQRHGAFIHPHLSFAETFEPSGPVLLPHSGFVANVPALPSQDVAQIVFGPDLSSSTLPIENSTSGYPRHDWVREPTLNACPYGYPICPGGEQCLFSHPLRYPTNYGSVDQSIPETTLAMSAQNTFCQPSAPSGYPGSSDAQGNPWSNMRTTYPPPPEPNQASARTTPSLAHNQRFSSDIHTSKQYTKFTAEPQNAAQPNMRNGPSAARNDSLEDILSRLSPKKQYIINERLKGKQWDDIRKGYKWRDLKSTSTLPNVLSDLRAKHDVINQILPSRQDPSSRASKSSRNAQRAVEILGDIYGLQNH
ncbi:hypothetical protein BFJ63_vAg16251 [Fusarium oxysporum f. sp. narcissi]|uniref:C3H1-type domain-containing protein n=1 Tax=Fusarium oxysporum f. sp. narcissi TaxID=451672 RepID=A0A4Q2V3L7_FUSOX|nr:Uncharacterized protein HZ326_28305 [Fusarium oxysporum f. sp. albedinis]RYC80860.1 hypothetical protein BFJ63_vAg16251 [Fusarium oxysporum f. sp. narcissi]